MISMVETMLRMAIAMSSSTSVMPLCEARLSVIEVRMAHEPPGLVSNLRRALLSRWKGGDTKGVLPLCHLLL